MLLGSKIVKLDKAIFMVEILPNVGNKNPSVLGASTQHPWDRHTVLVLEKPRCRDITEHVST